MISLAVGAALAMSMSMAAAPTVEVWRASATSPRVVLAPDPNAADAALHVLFRAGAADDLLEEGLTRVSQYALLHGQDGAPFAALDAALYGAGAELTVGTSVRECSFTVVSPKTGFDAIAAKMVKQLLLPKVSDEGVGRARRYALTDVLQVGSDEWQSAFVAAAVLVTEGLEGGGDYNNPIYGDASVIRRINAVSVKNHLREKLSPANAVVVVTGAFDPRKMKALLASVKGGKERALHRPDIVKYLPLERDSAAVAREIHLQLQVVDVSDARSAAVIHVMAAYLHDRLVWRLRKSGHVYSPSVTTSFKEWLDFILIGFEVTPGGAEKDLRAVMMNEIDELEAGKVDAGSLKRAAAIAKNRLEWLEMSPGQYAKELEAHARGVTAVGPEVRAMLTSVDEAALVDAAQKYLSRSRAVSFVFGTTRRENAHVRPKTGAGDDE